jgi:hypothetical protein
MNERSSQLFSQLVDINWELNNVDYPKTIKFALTEQYWKIKNELIDEMGIDAFNNFVEQGRRMFAPKGGYGDESPEEVENMMARVS